MHHGRVEHARKLGIAINTVGPVNTHTHKRVTPRRAFGWEQPPQQQRWLIGEKVLTGGVLLIVE
jgi:hypothetical protein